MASAVVRRKRVFLIYRQTPVGRGDEKCAFPTVPLFVRKQ
jgi:hypothetical protein